MKILVVEDDHRLASFIRRGLTEYRYAVDVTKDGEDAVFRAEISPYDLIILDIMLPGKDGITVCRELRHKKVDTPILVLTAKDDLQDKVTCFDLGADDYLTKPFAFKELLVRVAALLRRNRSEKTTKLQVADLELDQVKRKVTRGGKEIALTVKEYILLEYLMLNAGMEVTRTMISEHVWDKDFDTFSNIIDVYVRRLREKVDQGFSKPLIQTVKGVGYVMKES